MTNQQRNKQLAAELRALAEMVEYDGYRITARVTVEPTDAEFADAAEKYVPRAVRTVSSGRCYFESRALDGCLRVRLKGGAA